MLWLLEEEADAGRSAVDVEEENVKFSSPTGFPEVE